eukprot:TRINITY_DN44813_c0_g1_i1.p1 TRINITY_DN44813_c0_g1~~TRINITY_DN44813_c0_g1_i1.p1  ORF type:complete len:931 (+),score=177.93 TRINITY_DN44813_c0_g1_i1:199-2991(+)
MHPTFVLFVVVSVYSQPLNVPLRSEPFAHCGATASTRLLYGRAHIRSSLFQDTGDFYDYPQSGRVLSLVGRCDGCEMTCVAAGSGLCSAASEFVLSSASTTITCNIGGFAHVPPTCSPPAAVAMTCAACSISCQVRGGAACASSWILPGPGTPTPTSCNAGALLQADYPVSTIAGTGDRMYFDHSDPLLAGFVNPTALAVFDGSLYIADRGSHKIRVLGPSGMSLYAGSTSGYQNGMAFTARLDTPVGLAFNAGGVLYVADYGNHRIRIITGSVVSTFAGSGSQGTPAPGSPGTIPYPHGVHFVGLNLYVTSSHAVQMVSPAAVVTILAGSGIRGFVDGPQNSARFARPTGVVALDDDYLLIADTENNCLRKVALTDGQTSTYSGLCNAPSRPQTVDGTLATARFNQPQGITRHDDTVFVTEFFGRTVRMLGSDGTVSTLAGTPEDFAGHHDSVIGVQARFVAPAAVVYVDNHLIVADEWNHRIRSVRLVDEGRCDVPYEEALPVVCASCTLTCANEGVGVCPGALPSSVPDGQTAAAYVTCSVGALVSPTFLVSTFAGTGLPGNDDGDRLVSSFENMRGIVFNSFGRVFVTEASPTARVRVIAAHSGEVSTLPLGPVVSPHGIADASYLPGAVSGTLLVVDHGAHCVRQFTMTWSVFAGVCGSSGQLKSPTGIALGADYVIVADTANHVIRRFPYPSGTTQTTGMSGAASFKDGSSTVARFQSPSGVAVVPGNIVYVADQGNCCVRRITHGAASGYVTSPYGKCGSCGSQDGYGNEAKMVPSSVAFHAATGILFVSDETADAVRRIDTVTGLVTTIGAGVGSSDGDARTALFSNPMGLAVDGNSLFVVDSASPKVRQVALVNDGVCRDPWPNLSLRCSACEYTCTAGGSVCSQSSEMVHDLVGTSISCAPAGPPPPPLCSRGVSYSMTC